MYIVIFATRMYKLLYICLSNMQFLSDDALFFKF